MQLLQDFLLQSGFESQYQNFYEFDPERTMEQLHQALLEAMQSQGMIPQEMLDQLRERLEDYQNSDLSELINKLLERLAEEGYITIEQPKSTDGKLDKPQRCGAMRPPL